MKLIFSLLAALSLLPKSHAATKLETASVGDMMITCTQTVGDLSKPYYTATVFANKDGKGSLVVTNQGVVVFKGDVVTGGNGDTFPFANGKNASFYVDAENSYSGQVIFPLGGKQMKVEFFGDSPQDFPCSPTRPDWHWSPSNS